MNDTNRDAHARPKSLKPKDIARHAETTEADLKLSAPERNTYRDDRTRDQGYAGRRVVSYDNERAKGDHRHLGDLEEPYTFTTVEQMVADFLADVRKARGAA
jgi:hypothetical protein